MRQIVQVARNPAKSTGPSPSSATATARSRARAEASGRSSGGPRPDRDAQHALDGAPDMVGSNQQLPRPPRARSPASANSVAARSAWSGEHSSGASAAWISLQHLGDELDLDLTAGAQLHVPGAVRRQVAHACAPASRPHRRGCGPASPARARSPRRSPPRPCLADAGGPGDDACAGQRHAFPGPGDLGVVAAEGRQRDRDRPLIARRTQPHVHRIELAVHARRGHRRDIGVRGAHEPLAAPATVARTSAFGDVFGMIVDQHQVEIGARPSSPARRPCPAPPPPSSRRGRGRSGEAKSASTGGSNALSAASASAVAPQPRGVGVESPFHRGDGDREILLAHRAADDRDHRPPAAAHPCRRARTAAPPGSAVHRSGDSRPSKRSRVIARGARPATAPRRAPRRCARAARDCAETATGAARPPGRRARKVSNRPNVVSGCGWRAKRRQHARQHLVQQVARPLRAQRPDMPGLPAAHRGYDPLGVAKAEATQRRDRGWRARHRRRGNPAPCSGCAGFAADPAPFEHLGIVRTHPFEVAQQIASAKRGRVRIAHEGGEPCEILRRVPATSCTCRSATICNRCSTCRRNTIGGGQIESRHRRGRWPVGPAPVARRAWSGTRSPGSRPPQTSCSVCARNSISRMPPSPSFTLCPAMRATGRRRRVRPLCSSIRRFIAWMSATAAKSRPRRQTNGRIASRNAAPERADRRPPGAP